MCYLDFVSFFLFLCSCLYWLIAVLSCRRCVVASQLTLLPQNEPEHTLPVFVQNNSLPAFDKKDFSTAEICSCAEKTTGFNSIIGSQKNRSLWRIYPRDKGGRQKLLIKGMTVRGVHVTVKDKNPYLVRSLDGKEEETPAIHNEGDCWYCTRFVL